MRKTIAGTAAAVAMMMQADDLMAGTIFADGPFERRMRVADPIDPIPSAYVTLGYTEEDEARDQRKISAAEDKRARRAARLAAQVEAGGIEGVV